MPFAVRPYPITTSPNRSVTVLILMSIELINFRNELSFSNLVQFSEIIFVRISAIYRFFNWNWFPKTEFETQFWFFLKQSQKSNRKLFDDKLVSLLCSLSTEIDFGQSFRFRLYVYRTLKDSSMFKYTRCQLCVYVRIQWAHTSIEIRLRRAMKGEKSQLWVNWIRTNEAILSFSAGKIFVHKRIRSRANSLLNLLSSNFLVNIWSNFM